MEQASIIGIDLAKNSFQLHGAASSVLFRRKLTRGKVLEFVASQARCVVAMEACASAHHWGREIQKLGHEVKLVPPIYVKPFVKRQKNDTTDAEAICEAAQRPTMSFVAVKSQARQARGMVFRTRDLLVRQRTQTINALRGHLAEFGIVAPQGVAHLGRLAAAVEAPGTGLPEPVGELAGLLLERIAGLDEKIEELETQLCACAREDEDAARLMSIPGVGPITAMALQARHRWRASGAAGTSPPGSAWCRGNIRPAASRGWAGEDGSARSIDHRRHGGGAPRDSRMFQELSAAAHTNPTASRWECAGRSKGKRSSRRDRENQSLSVEIARDRQAQGELH